MMSQATAEVRTPRGILALALLVISAELILCLNQSAAAETRHIHTLSLMLVALSTYAWVLYPLFGSLLISGLTVVLLAWAWGVQQASQLGIDLATLVLLLSLVGWQQHQRLQRLRQQRQALEDLAEEHTVKTQAIALAQQTLEALQNKWSRYAQLQTIAEELSNLTELAAVAQLAVDRAFTLIGKSDAGMLFLVDPEQQELSLTASRRHDTLVRVRAKHGDQFDRHVLRTHRPLLVNDVRRDFRFTVTVSAERQVSSVIACPLLVGRNPEGVLRLDSAQPGVYTQDDLRFLDILLDLVSTAVTNAKLFARAQQLAMTDGLTGLSLRRPFLDQLTRELSRAARNREPVSVLMIDVDHFKSYNDTYGHTAGDVVLTTIGETLRSIAPPDGIVARYGGEEFSVLLPKMTRARAHELGETIRGLVEQRSLSDRQRPRVPVTVSIGAATFPEDAQVELELIRMADQRLYQAKHSGRNLVCSS